MDGTLTPTPHELIWLRELQRRAVERLPVDTRAMMVQLRDSLPKGFRPEMVNPTYLYNQGLSAEGLRVIGDEQHLLADVEQAIKYIRDRLIAHPSLAQVTAAEVASALRIPTERAENLLSVMSSVGNFFAGASGTASGFSSISFSERTDVLAEYLGFSSLEKLFERRNQTAAPLIDRQLVQRREAGNTVKTIANSVFILMSMDPQDDSLVDVHNAIRAECAAFGLDATRVDDIEHQDRITDQILQHIASAEFIVADLSGERPNVYYEVGYAHALGKRPVLVRKRDTRLHFDLLVHNVPEYRNIAELQTTLRKRFEAILGRSPRGTNPMAANSPR
jgi:hypothetical protein